MNLNLEMKNIMHLAIEPLMMKMKIREIILRLMIMMTKKTEANF